MKNILVLAAFLVAGCVYSQEQGSFFGGFESNSQLLLDDEGLRLSDDQPGFLAPDDNFRANNYLQLNYTLGKFTAGVQYESYLPSALLGYSPDFDENNGIATYYLNFKNDKLDLTGGYFYEQFGSGLLLRSWEDRQLGINTALSGVRVIYSPNDELQIKGVYGNQRNAFELSEGVVQGVDVNYDLAKLLDSESLDLTMGLSYVGRYQDTATNDNIPSIVNAYAGRLDFSSGKIYGGFEAALKDPDVIANEGVLVSDRLYDGTALQFNLGYVQKGLGINSTFRRLENFGFYVDRLAEGNQFNQQLINYTPALTKQQDYLLTNIYVYNPQARIITDNIERRVGEVGAQGDFYYTFPKGSVFGKYKTKLAANFSYWAGLDTEFNDDLSYTTSFVGAGDRYFRDINFEIKNKWSKKFRSVFTFQDVIVDKGVSLGGPLGVQGDIKATIAVAEGTWNLGKGRSFRAVGQHLWTKDDRKNWAAAVLEYNFSSQFNVYFADSYNYGGEGKLHYYNVGGSYSKGRTRFSMNYGRQRGGLICVGGVCRFVPESNGLTASLAVTF